MLDFAKRVALVTGSTSGIGQATALLIARLGGVVVVHGQNKDRLKNTLELFKKNEIPDSRVHHILGPITDVDLRQKLIDQTLEKYGRLDILINNAGTMNKKGLEALDLENVEHVWNVNARSCLALTTLATPHLAATKGNIVNLSSITAHMGAANMISYSMSKAAIEIQTRSLAVQLAPSGIRVNAVCPGLTRTNLAEVYGIPEEKFEESYRGYVPKKIPLCRMADPSEIANVIVFLASDLASFVTGSIYTVDGGQLAGTPNAPPKKSANK